MEIAALIKEAREGSSAAQKCLFDLFAEKMMLVCCRYLKSKQDAEEALLDGFLKFFRNLGNFQFHGEKALYAYIKQVMVNECLMKLRKKTVFTISSEPFSEDIFLPEDALDSLTANEIFQLILQLPTGYRTVFNLFVMEGMDHREIGTLLGIAEGTSKSQLSKARALLQNMLLQKDLNYAKRKSR